MPRRVRGHQPRSAFLPFARLCKRAATPHGEWWGQVRSRYWRQGAGRLGCGSSTSEDESGHGVLSGVLHQNSAEEGTPPSTSSMPPARVTLARAPYCAPRWRMPGPCSQLLGLAFHGQRGPQQGPPRTRSPRPPRPRPGAVRTWGPRGPGRTWELWAQGACWRSPTRAGFVQRVGGRAAGGEAGAHTGHPAAACAPPPAEAQLQGPQKRPDLQACKPSMSPHTAEVGAQACSARGRLAAVPAAGDGRIPGA